MHLVYKADVRRPCIVEYVVGSRYYRCQPGLNGVSLERRDAFLLKIVDPLTVRGSHRLKSPLSRANTATTASKMTTTTTTVVRY